MAAAPIIQSVQLKGHQAAVTCLDHSSSTGAGGSSSSSSSNDNAIRPSLLLSGSEDGTCRLWDLRIGRTVTCIKCRDSNCASGGQQEQEVLSVAFGPSWKNMTDGTATEESEVLSSPFAHDFSVYASVGNGVYGYDLRKGSSPIITQPSVNLSDLLEAPDDVNQIAFSPIRAPAPTSSLINNKKGGRKKSTNQKSASIHALQSIHLATVDDGGTVRVTADWTLQGKHSGNGTKRRVLCHGEDVMVTSMAYAPRNFSNSTSSKQQYLASGGTDCCIRIWDVGLLQAQHTKPVASMTFANTDTGANQVCNPPMVHSLNYSPSGRLLAAGLGDGSIAIVQGQVVTARMEDAHTGSVASCIFPAWNSTSSHAITAHDRLLCSIGNDGCVVLWDLGATIAGNTAINPTHYLPTTSSSTTTHVSSSVKDELPRPTTLAVDDHNGSDAELDQPQTIFAFQHTAGKPNWMVSGRVHDPVFASSVFVADTTKDISIYTIPLQ